MFAYYDLKDNLESGFAVPPTINVFSVYLLSDLNVVIFFLQVGHPLTLDGVVIRIQGACYTLKVVRCTFMSAGNIE